MIYVSVIRFIGDNKIPKVNPLAGVPLFKELQDAIAKFLVHGNVAMLEAAVAVVAAAHEKRSVQGALLLAAFHEIALIAVLPLEYSAGLRQRRVDFAQWLDSSAQLDALFDSSERAVFRMFAGSNPAAVASAGGISAATAAATVSSNSFLLSPESSTDVILRVRLAAHVTAGARFLY